MSIDQMAIRSLAAALLAVSGCGGGWEPAPEGLATSPEPPAAAAEPTSLQEIFPEGLGRAMVLDACGACHAAACSAIGQRTLDRWANLKEDHRDKVSEVSEEDYNVLFAYLGENFNDGKPEPVVPPQFLEGGCTPY